MTIMVLWITMTTTTTCEKCFGVWRYITDHVLVEEI